MQTAERDPTMFTGDPGEGRWCRRRGFARNLINMTWLHHLRSTWGFTMVYANRGPLQ